MTNDAYPSIFHDQPSYLSSVLPAKRKDPNERRLVQERKDEEKFKQYLQNDNITSFDSFNQGIASRLSHPWMTINFEGSDSVCIVKCDPSVFPKFPISIKVTNDLSVKIWENGNIVSPLTFKWLFGKEQKCLNWSTFDSMISYLNSFTASADDKISSAILLLNDFVNLCTDDIKKEKIIFINEQLKLCQGIPRYSTDLIIWASSIYYSYPAAYVTIRDKNKLIFYLIIIVK